MRLWGIKTKVDMCGEAIWVGRRLLSMVSKRRIKVTRITYIDSSKLDYNWYSMYFSYEQENRGAKPTSQCSVQVRLQRQKTGKSQTTNILRGSKTQVRIPCVSTKHGSSLILICILSFQSSLRSFMTIRVTFFIFNTFFPFRTSIERNKTTFFYMLGLAILTTGLSYAAVPLYRMFCQVR